MEEQSDNLGTDLAVQPRVDSIALAHSRLKNKGHESPQAPRAAAGISRFAREDGESSQESRSEDALVAWKRKKKHFLILSAAGKPIYTRHGSDAVISSYVGIIQTIISSYNDWDNSLHSFRTARTMFVVMSQTNLFLVAISSLPESEGQLKAQLEALYMQILSTLTLPTLTHIFSVRPSSDLRRPLQGTEVLLSALANSASAMRSSNSFRVLTTYDLVCPSRAPKAAGRSLYRQSWTSL